MMTFKKGYFCPVCKNVFLQTKIELMQHIKSTHSYSHLVSYLVRDLDKCEYDEESGSQSYEIGNFAY